MKSLSLVLLLAVLPSCRLFQPDAQPAINAKMAQTEGFLEVASNFRQIVSTANGITEAQRTAILVKIAAAVDQYEALDRAQIDYLGSIKASAHAQMLQQAMELYKQFRSKQL
jgi:uncharacterized protein (DUF952 family)